MAGPEHNCAVGVLMRVVRCVVARGTGAHLAMGQSWSLVGCAVTTEATTLR